MGKRERRYSPWAIVGRIEYIDGVTAGSVFLDLDGALEVISRHSLAFVLHFTLPYFASFVFPLSYVLFDRRTDRGVGI